MRFLLHGLVFQWSKVVCETVIIFISKTSSSPSRMSIWSTKQTRFCLGPFDWGLWDNLHKENGDDLDRGSRFNCNAPSWSLSVQTSHWRQRALIAALKGLTNLGSARMEWLQGMSIGETVSQLSLTPTTNSGTIPTLASCEELLWTSSTRPSFTLA